MNDAVTNQEGVRKLMHTILSGAPTPPFDDENDELQDFLKEAAYLTTQDLADLGTQIETLSATRRNRARVRYLAALMPEKSLHELANVIHYVMDNAHLTITDVRDILRGGKRDVPLEKIQKIGKSLIDGNSVRKTAIDIGVSYETVSRIESFVGIQEARRLKLVDFACDAIREGWSVRGFASAAGIPKSTAHLMMVRAKQVLQELGEKPSEVFAEVGTDNE
jgi:hypothetical protein